MNNPSGFEKRRKGHIVITDHDDDSWYRNIKIRKRSGVHESFN